MNVHRDLNRLPSFRNAIITTGTFDGVHRGHRALIERIRHLAEEAGGESVLITFHPHPRSVVFPNDPSLKILSTLDEKIELLAVLGIDHLVVAPFTAEFSQLSAADYVSEFLVKHFHPSTVVTGYNHQFGHHRDGNMELLRLLAPGFGYSVEEIPKQMVENINVSSTRIRIALQEGDIITANHLLGHRYQLSGTVVHGNQLGRKLGYPTANISIQDPLKLIPADGVYAVRAAILPGKTFFDGVSSIGFRPTVNGTSHTIEAYLFEFDADVYGKELVLELVQRIREERKFETVDLMVDEIRRDEKTAREILSAFPA